MVLLLLLALQDLDGLLRGLAEDDVQARDRAAAGILERWDRWTEADLAKLRRAAKGEDRETASRAEELLQRVELRRLAGPALVGRVRDFERIVLSGSTEERVRLIWEAATLWRRADLDTEPFKALCRMLVERDSRLTACAITEGDSFSPVVRPMTVLFEPSIRHEDRAERLEALNKLRFLDDRACLDRVRPLLKDPDEEIRLCAALALAEWRDSGGESVAASFLSHPRSGMRADAVRTLARIGNPARADEIAALLKDERDVRVEALRALGRLGARQCEEAVVEQLRDKEPGIRMAAIETLGRWKSVSRAPEILPAIRSADAHERREALETLLALGSPALESVLVEILRENGTDDPWRLWDAVATFPGDFRSKVRPFLSHSAARIRQSAAAALAEHVGPPAAPDLRPLLQDEAPEVRLAAVRALADVRPADLQPFLRALSDSDEDVRIGALRALGRLGARQHAKEVAALLDKNRVRPTLAAVEVLGWFGAYEFRDAIATHLDGQSRRESALLALGWIGEPKDAPLLVEAMRSPDALVRERGVQALSLLESGEAALVERLRDPERDVVWRALWALGEGASPEPEEALVGMLDHDLRGFAAEALLARHAAKRFPAALDLLGDPDHFVRQRVALAAPRPVALAGSRADRECLERRLTRLMEDTSADVQTAAELGLVALSRREPSPALFDTELLPYQMLSLVEALALAREGKTVARCHRRIKLDRAIDSSDGLIASFQESLGLRLEIAPGIVWCGRVRAGLETTGARLVGRLMLSTSETGPEPCDLAAVPEGDTVRVVPLREAVLHWKKRLGVK